MAPPAAAGRLATESSPFLARHDGNPVAWQPWGQAALDQARRENRMIFLSVGYASCHACLVMEEDTFSQPRVAALLNDHFLPILVDREERPDLDARYQEVVRLLGGEGGWPLNLFLAPDLTPIHGGGFFPAEDTHGRPGLLTVGNQLLAAWTHEREHLLQDLDRVRAELSRAVLPPPPAGETDPAGVMELARAAWADRYDPRFAGFDQDVKFPRPALLSFLFVDATVSGHGESAQWALATLRQMAVGGLRDHLTGAFHRYSADPFWQVPHFEIPLADNALLATLYLDAAAWEDARLHQELARGILDDLLRRFLLADGLFASSLAADNADGEGGFTTWTPGEVDGLLGQEGPVFRQSFLDGKRGTLRGRSLIRFLGPWDHFSWALNRHGKDLARLAAARERRSPSPRDDKAITADNALMISALARSGRMAGGEGHAQAARRAMMALLSGVAVEGLPRYRLDGQPRGEGFLDDYAFTIAALLDLHASDFDLSWLQKAQDLAQVMMTRFAVTGHPLALAAVRPDGETPFYPVLHGEFPTGNAVALASLWRLAHLEESQERLGQARDLEQALLPWLASDPLQAVPVLAARAFAPEHHSRLILVGKQGEAGIQAMLREARRRHLPGMVVGLASEEAAGRYPMLAPRPRLDGQPTAYLCYEKLCRPPVTDPAMLGDWLDHPPAGS